MLESRIVTLTSTTNGTVNSTTIVTTVPSADVVGITMMRSVMGMQAIMISIVINYKLMISLNMLNNVQIFLICVRQRLMFPNRTRLN